jgi:very-short-patch-repair endonuclease
MPRARREPSTIPTERVEPHVDARVAGLASRQHGVISRAQLRDLGIEDSAIAYRIGAGRLHRVQRGVYAVGHPVLAPRARWLAAVLTCGPGAALGYASAAALWGIRPSAAEWIDVVVPKAGGRRRRARLRIHRHPALQAGEVTTHERVPVTTPARTLLDLAAVLPPRKLHRALDQTEILELTDYPALAATARAHPGHRGSARLRRALAEHTAGTTPTRSDLEELFLEICRAHRLPTPLVNQFVGEETVDFLFVAERLIVEADSWRYHRTREAFDRDRRRDWTHAGEGYRTLRFTDRQLEREPQTVAEMVRGALAQRRTA